MDLKKEKNDATKKKGVALSDEERTGVTGGLIHCIYKDNNGNQYQTSFEDEECYSYQEFLYECDCGFFDIVKIWYD